MADPTKPSPNKTPVTDFGLQYQRGAWRKALSGPTRALIRAAPTAGAPVQSFPIATINATQGTLRNSSLRRHTASPQAGYHGDTEPLVVQHQGQNWLWDGHHRTAVAQAAGATEIQARHVNLDHPEVHAALTEHRVQMSHIAQRLSDVNRSLEAKHGLQGARTWIDAPPAFHEERKAALGVANQQRAVVNSRMRERLRRVGYRA